MMVSEERAKKMAKEFSEKYPDRSFRVYRTPSGNHWVRGDPSPLESVDGHELINIAVYRNGIKV
jgi:hypothetical protein